MPELPEVESIVRSLKKKILLKKISKIHVYLDKVIRNNKRDFIKKIKGSTIKDILRRGKFIIIKLSGGDYLAIHLKLSGQLFYLPSKTPKEKHTHLIFEFKDSKDELRYRDVRQFGYVKLLDSSSLDEFLSSRIGPDYLSISYEDFKDALKSRKRIIRSLLLDQKVFSGLGNIYVNEALYQASIYPKATSSKIKEVKLKNLYKAIISVLKDAIRLKGSSVDDYFLPDTSKGEYQKKHRVYQKKGEGCPRCGTKIECVKMNGRSSYFCPKCQKLRP